MNVLILNGTPKKKDGASVFFSKQLSKILYGCKTQTTHLRNRGDFSQALFQLQNADAVVLSVPLYVDSVPSHILEFLMMAEQYCIQHNCHFKLYVISNSGFIEGKQNHVHLNTYECWCQRSDIEWGGGIGIGGGVMLKTLSVVFPILIFAFTIFSVFCLIKGADLSFSLFAPIVENVLLYLFFNIGVLTCNIRLASAIKSGKCMKNIYTRVMLPSFLFIIVTDIFMVLSALFNGKILFTLLKKDTPNS